MSKATEAMHPSTKINFEKNSEYLIFGHFMFALLQGVSRLTSRGRLLQCYTTAVGLQPRHHQVT